VPAGGASGTRLPREADRDELLRLLRGGAPQRSAWWRARTDGGASVRRAAAEALGDVDDATVVEALCESFQEPDPAVLAAVVDAVVRQRDPRAIPHLADAVAGWSDESYEAAREAALRGLLCFRSPEACCRLVASLVERPTGAPTAWGRDALSAVLAAETTGNGARRVAELLVEYLADPREPIAARAQDLLSTVPEEAVEPLIDRLRAGTGLVGRRAALALAATRGGLAFDALVSASQTGSVEVRAAATRALGTLGDPAAVPALVAALQEEDEAVRAEAATALDALGVGPATAGAVAVAAARVVPAASEAEPPSGEPPPRAQPDRAPGVRRRARQRLLALQARGRRVRRMGSP